MIANEQTLEDITVTIHQEIHVQAPLDVTFAALLEFVGPIFASFPLVNNVQYRLSEVEGGTRIVFRHTALGLLTSEHKAEMPKGWASMHDRVRRQAEAG